MIPRILFDRLFRIPPQTDENQKSPGSHPQDPAGNIIKVPDAEFGQQAQDTQPKRKGSVKLAIELKVHGVRPLGLLAV